MADQTSSTSGGDPPESDEPAELAPPPLSEIGKDRPSAGDSSDSGSENASEPKALEDPKRLRELQESLGWLLHPTLVLDAGTETALGPTAQPGKYLLSRSTTAIR
jgi:hypothetical protein